MGFTVCRGESGECSGEPRTGVRGCGASFVARAFQPEICRFAFGASGECGTVGRGSLTRSREGAKEGAKVRWRQCVFEYEYEYRPRGRTEYEYEGGISVRCSGEPRTGVRGWFSFVARAFQPEICRFAFGASGECGTGGRGVSREAAKGTAECGEVTGVMDCAFLLSTFSRLPSMAWMPWPPHPRPLSPVSRGRGGELWASRGRESAGGSLL